ncbi:serine/threonine-protein kinase Nek4-like [Acanthopagrus latus]|uniref:serine/threonine-protein kinase Nek4-like n=1 Tax=Acanthopagrus latus TaxID=8177 RepID=UPI00187C4CCB|nr:serine/threonine-protein kinase Nek4-like [Acanthopagrus latus]
MGSEQSTLQKKGFRPENETRYPIVATKGDEKFFIKKIDLLQTSGNADPALNEIEILMKTSHPHIVSFKDSFRECDTYYVVMNYCQGGSLASKIRETRPPQEFEVLSWIVEITMALKTMHEKGLVHKHLTPENVLLTEYGTVRLGESGKIYENSKQTQPTGSDQSEKIRFLAPEVFTDGVYDAKSDIWSMGCILYELSTQHSAFSAETSVKLIPKIIGGPYPSLPEHFSPELCKLLSDIFKKDPQSRPTVQEILGCPIMIRCLSEKSKRAVDDLQTKLDNLRKVADGLERVHQGTTIVSLAGGVIGAAGGITSIVGVILAPFTLGASLIVTGVGVGVGVAGGLTASVSNITDMVNQSSDRKAVRSIIKEFEERMNALVTWLQEIKNSLELIKDKCDLADTLNMKGNQLNKDNLVRLSSRAGRGLGGIAELVRLIQVMNIGRIAAQTSKALRAAEAVTGVLSGLFLAVDIFFIAMDAKELHHIRQAKAAEERAEERAEDGDTSESMSETETSDFASTSDQDALVASSMKQEVPPQPQNQASQNDTQIRSEIMKFVRSIRQAADKLQRVLDELKTITSSIPSLHSES